jgi:hypothetical protein
MRRPVTVVALVVTVALLIAGALWTQAGAQTASQVFVISDWNVEPSNGHVAIPGLGRNAGTLGASCTGARPLGGPNIPGQVVTSLDADAIRLRVIRNTGTAISGVVVQVNCTVAVEAGAAAGRLQQLTGR